MRVSSEEFRRACARFATGVAIATVADAAGAPHGLTVSSFTSVSLHPPLILICLVVALILAALWHHALPGELVEQLAQAIAQALLVALQVVHGVLVAARPADRPSRPPGLTSQGRHLARAGCLAVLAALALRRA